MGEPAQEHPWWQEPAWVPVFSASVIETGVMLVPGRAGLVGGLLIAL